MADSRIRRVVVVMIKKNAKGDEMARKGS